MASSRRTYNTDTITLKTVFAKDINNSNIPAQRVLTANGLGGTYWAIPSTLGLNGGFNQIVTSAGNYTADLSYNTFRLSSGPGIGMVDGPIGSNQTSLFAKAFQQIDVSGGNLLASFSNGYLYPTLKIAGEGAIQVRSDPTNNTFIIRGPMTVNTVSTGIYGFSQLQVIPSISTPISNANQQFGYYLTANSPSTVLTFAGINDIQLSTNVTTNTVFMSISSFTSKGYLALSGESFSAYGRATSTISTNYVDKSTFVTTVSSLSTNFGGISNVLFSTISWLALSTGLEFYTLTGLINARATIVQLNDTVLTISQQQTSTVKGLGSAGYISSIVSPTSITSTVQGLGSAGYISSTQLISTTQGLQYGYQTSGFVSSPNLIGHVSTAYLNTTLVSTVQGLGSAGYISSTQLISTVTASGSLFASTVKGLGSAGYLSTASGGSVPSNLTISTLITSSTIQGQQYLGNTKSMNWSQTASISTNWSGVTGGAVSGIYYACVNSGFLYYSSNGGVSWTQQGTSQAWTGIGTGITATTAVACIAGGGIYYTSNSGTTWTLSASAPTANWSAICGSYSSGTTFYACVNGGGVYISTDSGVTWTLITGSVNASWTAINCSNQSSLMVVVNQNTSTYKNLWFQNGTSGTLTADTSSPIGNWNSVAVINNYESAFMIVLGRNDGFIYIAPPVQFSGSSFGTYAINTVSGYIGSLLTGNAIVACFPNSPIAVSYNNGTSWITTNSPSLPWSCAVIGQLPRYSTSFVNQSQYINPTIVGTNTGYLWSDLGFNNLPTTTIIGHDTTIQSDTGNILFNTQNVFLNCKGSVNMTGVAITLTNPTGYINMNGTTKFLASLTCYLPKNTQMNSPGGADVRQPFIQYGTVTGLTGATGSTIVTLAQAYTSQTSFVPTATVANFPPAMVFTSTITSGTFMIGWSSIATGSQAFYWNTMGT